MKPFFSIIIPTLNEENFLPNLLKDLVKQKEKNFEVFIVDGSSEDQTEEVTLDFSEKIPLEFIESKKRNVSYQRNIGAKNAKGKYLLFIDADSGIDASFTKKLKLAIQKRGGLLFIPYIFPTSADTQTKIFFQLANSVIEMSQILGKPFSSGGSMIIENNFFKSIGGFAEDVFLSEDHQIVNKANSWGVKGIFLPNIKIKFSLRRMRKEGKLKLLAKYIYSFILFALKGNIKNKIFDYQMGGQLYLSSKKKDSLEITLNKYSKQTKSFFDKLF